MYVEQECEDKTTQMDFLNGLKEGVVLLQTLIASIIIFGLIIFVHEFGHYSFAKISGIRVEEFALGMGPKVVSFKRGETLYSLRAFPLGGFCKMSGETGNEDYSPTRAYDPKRFDQKPILSRMAVIVGGPLMNFLLAALLLTLIFTVLGVPKDYTNAIGEVVAGTPAEEAGLKSGDKILEIDGNPVESWSNLVEIIHAKPEKEISLKIERADKQFVVNVVPSLDPQSNTGKIGITPGEAKWERIGFAAGIKEGITRTYQITFLTIAGLIEMIRGKVSTEGIAGPVGIIQIIGESARYGFVYLANLTAVISINLGLINLLPIPALDGSRLIFLMLEAVRGRPVNPSKENFVHLVGFVLLMVLMVLITYKDILKLSTGNM